MTGVLVFTSDVAVAVAALNHPGWETVVAADSEALARGLREDPTTLVLDSHDLDEYATGLVSIWVALHSQKNPGEDGSFRVLVLSGDDDGETQVDVLSGEPGVSSVSRRAFLDRAAAPREDKREEKTQDDGEDVLRGNTAGAAGAVAAEAAARNPAHYGSHLVVVTSPKGGVGKTFVAVNLAHLLAECMGGDDVLLVDLDLYASDAAAALNLFSGPDINDLLPYSGTLTPELVRSKCRCTSAGLHVLAGPERPELADLVTPDFVRELVTVSRQAFTYVVVDTPPNPGNELLYDLLESASRRVIVSGPSSLGLRQLRQFLQLAGRLELGAGHKTDVIINMYSDDALISLQGIRDLLGVPVRVLARAHALVERSMLDGVPLVASAPDHQVARGLREVAGQFSPVVVARPDDTGWGRIGGVLRRLLTRFGTR